jgi:GT2 family glycosyltransferase
LHRALRDGRTPRGPLLRAPRHAEPSPSARASARLSPNPHAEARPRVVVSIVSHGHRDAVLALLRDLARHARHSVARVVLTLNVAEPGLEAAAASACAGLPLSLLRNERPLGFGANHNAAFAHAFAGAHGGAEHFAVLNPDVRLHADPFPALCAALARDARAGCAFPEQRDAGGRPCNPPRPVPTPANLLRRYVGGGELAQRADWVNAAFALFRASAYQALGGFDPRYRLYCEDVDLCLRLQLGGWHLARAACAVQHAGSRASRASALHLYWHVRSLVKFWCSGTLRAYLQRY